MVYYSKDMIYLKQEFVTQYKQIIKLNYDNNLWNEHLPRLHLHWRSRLTETTDIR